MSKEQEPIEVQAVAQAFPLGRMYGQMFKGIYTELINSNSLPSEVAMDLALKIMQAHMEMSSGRAKSKDKDSAESILSALITKGGSA